MELDIGELLRSAAKRAQDEDNDSGRDRRLHPLAQVMELHDRWKRTHDNIAFPELGTVMREKRGFSNTKHPERGEIMYMIWAKLDLANPMHAAIVAEWGKEFPLAPETDCIVGFIPAPSTAVIFRPHCSTFLEPADAGDLDEFSAVSRSD